MRKFSGTGKTIDEAIKDAVAKAMAEQENASIIFFEVKGTKGQYGGFVGSLQMEVEIAVK